MMPRTQFRGSVVVAREKNTHTIVHGDAYVDGHEHTRSTLYITYRHRETAICFGAQAVSQYTLHVCLSLSWVCLTLTSACTENTSVRRFEKDLCWMCYCDGDDKAHQQISWSRGKVCRWVCFTWTQLLARPVFWSSPLGSVLQNKSSPEVLRRTCL